MSESSRRHFIRLVSASLFIPLVNIPTATAAVPLQEDDPVAKALDYRKQAAVAEQQKLPGFVAGSRCDNCLHYTANDQGCRLFHGKTVEPGGWCKAWIKKP